MNEPVTQAQDHDRRIGRLEGITEQLTYRLDSIERAIETQGRELRQAIEEQSRRIDALRQEHRRDFRWLVGIQLTTLLALGTLILSRLPG